MFRTVARHGIRNRSFCELDCRILRKTARAVPKTDCKLLIGSLTREVKVKLVLEKDLRLCRGERRRKDNLIKQVVRIDVRKQLVVMRVCPRHIVRNGINITGVHLYAHRADAVTGRVQNSHILQTVIKAIIIVVIQHLKFHAECRGGRRPVIDNRKGRKMLRSYLQNGKVGIQSLAKRIDLVVRFIDMKYRDLGIRVILSAFPHFGRVGSNNADIPEGNHQFPPAAIRLYNFARRIEYRQIAEKLCRHSLAFRIRVFAYSGEYFSLFLIGQSPCSKYCPFRQHTGRRTGLNCNAIELRAQYLCRTRRCPPTSGTRKQGLLLFDSCRFGGARISVP